MGNSESSDHLGNMTKEVEFDYIEAPDILLPNGNLLQGVNFGYVNSVREEIERLIRHNGLGRDENKYQLVICQRQDSGNETTIRIMEPWQCIEYYTKELSCGRNMLKLYHISQE